MTAIVWDDPGSRIYEYGVDRGVLYPPDAAGVAWNGLTKVDERSSGTVEPLYFDGKKFNDVVTLGEFSGTIRALTYPDEFGPFEGIEFFDKGVFLYDQDRERFNISYRTQLGNDIGQSAYRIHILYNLTAVPSNRSNTTMSLTPEPLEFEWAVTAIPEEIEGYQPTAHIVIDSRKIDPWLLQDLEAILYGDATRDPELPPIQGLINYIAKWDRLIIEVFGDGTWAATSAREGQIVMLDGESFQINDANATYSVPGMEFTISSTEANEEDLWQP